LTDDYVRVFCPEAASLAGTFAEAEMIEVATGGVLGHLARVPQWADEVVRGRRETV